jgi:Transposase
VAARLATDQAHGCVTQDFARVLQEKLMGQRTVGIDLAIRGDHVARILDDGRPHAKPIRFRLTSDSLGQLVARLRDGLPADGTVTAVMEPTGMSWFPVARWLDGAGIRVIRVKGQRVRALRRYLSEHAKTDAADAYVLGAIPLFGGVPADPRSTCLTRTGMRCSA